MMVLWCSMLLQLCRAVQSIDTRVGGSPHLEPPEVTTTYVDDSLRMSESDNLLLLVKTKTVFSVFGFGVYRVYRS